jgi:hypothetical protein
MADFDRFAFCAPCNRATCAGELGSRGKNGQHQLSHVMSQLDQSRIISHRFLVGRTVRLSQAARLRNAAPGSYEVLAQLPERDGEFQYRLKSDREPYQRIAKEHELEPI